MKYLIHLLILIISLKAVTQDTLDKQESHFEINGFSLQTFWFDDKTKNLGASIHDVTLRRNGLVSTYEIRHNPKYAEYIELSWLRNGWITNGVSLFSTSSFRWSFEKESRKRFVNPAWLIPQISGTLSMEAYKSYSLTPDLYTNFLQDIYQYTTNAAVISVRGNPYLRGIILEMIFKTGFRMSFNKFYSDSIFEGFVSSDFQSSRNTDVQRYVYLQYGWGFSQRIGYDGELVSPWIRYSIRKPWEKRALGTFSEDWQYQQLIWIGFDFKFSLMIFG